MEFDNRIKNDFRNNGQKWAVDVGIEAEIPEADIEEGYGLDQQRNSTMFRAGDQSHSGTNAESDHSSPGYRQTVKGESLLNFLKFFTS